MRKEKVGIPSFIGDNAVSFSAAISRDGFNLQRFGNQPVVSR
jgi:hypothetical protein